MNPFALIHVLLMQPLEVLQDSFISMMEPDEFEHDGDKEAPYINLENQKGKMVDEIDLLVEEENSNQPQALIFKNYG